MIVKAWFFSDAGTFAVIRYTKQVTLRLHYLTIQLKCLNVQ